MKEGVEVDASSIIDILSLACISGTTVRLRMEHPDDTAIIDDIALFIESGLGD